MIEDVVCDVSQLRLDIEQLVEKQVVIQYNLFPNLDKTGRPVCNDFINGSCARDTLCPLRHLKCEKSIVYNCSNKDCPFLHGDVDSKLRNCPFYDRGFCSNGKNCKFRHVPRPICMDYVCGFCIEGSNCKNGHPKFESLIFEEPQAVRSSVVCHACNEPGHKSTACPLVEMFKNKARMEGNLDTANLPPGKRPLELVTCFKCRERGHYANKCPLGAGDPQKILISKRLSEL
ncbi:Cleavage and polyadenylation specificity factor subunit 4 [Thelohanellus kitauei]|uniref:Cleavage and polyadenylation specificity factor subunit 4 n=1 Tax=Thelohanellus kitauei TaxID=669202 RepID=A0A0C2ID49_THEKT|nr:Cleavage and polyadenylation specificity factor subunit 4 [Thelohanellus kitauei]